jgi:DNA-binding MurR/RpiR family transcriptional regulator
MLSAEIADLDSEDLLVAIDFPRYESAVIAAAEFGKESGATVLAMTDGPLSPLASVADVWTGLTIEAVGPFDSVVPAIALVELLVAEVAVLLRNQATTRLDKIEARWAASQVFQDGLRSDRTEETP